MLEEKHQHKPGNCILQSLLETTVHINMLKAPGNPPVKKLFTRISQTDSIKDVPLLSCPLFSSVTPINSLCSACEVLAQTRLELGSPDFKSKVISAEPPNLTLEWQWTIMSTLYLIVQMTTKQITVKLKRHSRPCKRVRHAHFWASAMLYAFPKTLLVNKCLSRLLREPMSDCGRLQS